MIYPLTLNKSDPEFLFFESKLDYFGSHEFYSWQPKYLFWPKRGLSFGFREIALPGQLNYLTLIKQNPGKFNP